MARLIINGDLTVLAPKVVRALKVRSLSVEDIASRCQTNKDVIRSALSKLREKLVVDHDGQRPRTWSLIDHVEWERIPTKTAGIGDQWFQRRFTEDEDAVLIGMRGRGASFSEIGEELGRRRDVVKNRYLVVYRAHYFRKLKEQEAA